MADHSPQEDEKGALTAADLYRDLRRLGTIHLRPEQSGIIPGARRRARNDGLRVMVSRSSRRGLTPEQARRRSLEVSLTDRFGTTVVAPDLDAIIPPGSNGATHA